MTRVTKLELYDRNLNSDGAFEIALTMSQSYIYLETLDLTITEIDDRGAIELLDAIKSTNISVLRMNSKRITIETYKHALRIAPDTTLVLVSLNPFFKTIKEEVRKMLGEYPLVIGKTNIQ